MGKLLKKIRSFNRRAMTLRGFTPMSMSTTLECPKCNSKLRQNLDQEGPLTPFYVCRKCGYGGPIALQPRKSAKNKGRLSK